MALRRSKKSTRNGKGPKKKDYIDRLFDSFTVKDMPRAEFRRRFKAAIDPERLKADMVDIRRRKRGLAETKREIDNAMGE